MIIALDYDHTYTEDKELWNTFIILARSRGHEVICITMRKDNEEEKITLPCQVVYTERKAKAPKCAELGIDVSIWIDDKPHFVHNDHPVAA